MFVSIGFHLLCIFVYFPVYVCLHVCWGACVEARRQPWYYPSGAIHSGFFETGWVTKAWGPYIRLGWLDSESQGSVCLVSISSPLELQVWLPYPPFYMGSGDQTQLLILEQQALYKPVWSPQSPHESVTYISLSEPRTSQPSWYINF